mgnify:CR=1 FL=1
MRHLPQENYRLTGLGDQQVNGLKAILKTKETQREICIINRISIGDLSTEIINLKQEIKRFEA